MSTLAQRQPVTPTLANETPRVQSAVQRSLAFGLVAVALGLAAVALLGPLATDVSV